MTDQTLKSAFVLINLGTPDAPTTPAVRRYLREFLSDPRVLTMPALLRFLLLNFVILPFRSPKSTKAYATVWTDAGSPLKKYGEDLQKKMQSHLGNRWDVFLAMRYGRPSVASVIEQLGRQHYREVVLFPLFPQYSSAAFGSAVEKFYKMLVRLNVIPAVRVIGPYYDDPAFIEAIARVTQPHLDSFQPDHILMSYHGLPENHCTATDPTRAHCLQSADCCAKIVAANAQCYRAQCYATSRSLVDALKLDPGKVSAAFQSRLGRTPWIQPYTDKIIEDLRSRGVKRLLVMEPSFAADCLETVEEIGVRLRADWEISPEYKLFLVPCLNAEDIWVEACATIAGC